MIANPAHYEGYLLSSPKSGNTWVRYCIETLTDYDTNFTQLSPKPEGAPIIAKSHSIHPNKAKQLGREKKLILLVRNYKEILCRYASFRKPGLGVGRLNQLLDMIAKKEFHYFHNLESYDIWDEDKKLLLYYEDIIKNPRESLEKLVEFLEGDPNTFETFMERYEEHQKRAIKIYDANFHGSSTKGKGTIYHSKKASPQRLKKIDDLVMTTYPELTEKYLMRYQ